MTDAEGEVTVEKLVLRPEWLDSSDDSSPKREFRFYTIYLGVSSLLMGLIFLSEPYLRQFLSTSLIIWLSTGVLYAVSREVKSLRTWRRHDDTKKISNLPLKRISAMMDRAMKGKILSQALIEKRLKKIFFQKLKDQKSLSSEEMNKITDDPETLRRFIEDDDIVDFLLNSKDLKTGEVIKNTEKNTMDIEEKRKEINVEKGESYKRKIEEIMDKISRWRA